MTEELLNMLTTQINMVTVNRKAKGIIKVMKSTCGMFDFLTFELFFDVGEKFSSSNLFRDKINSFFESLGLFLLLIFG